MPTSKTGAPAAADRDLERDARALQDAVASLVRLHQVRDRDCICCHDISVTQCNALEALVEHGPLRLGALADRLYLDKSTTSRVVATLVRKRYAAQRAEAGDRRAVTLVATGKGRRLCARITEDLVADQRGLLLDLDPAVRASVIRVVRGLALAAAERFRTGTDGGAACATPACGPDSSTCR